MNKEFKIFNSHEEADNAEIEFYSTLEPNKRVELLLDIISNYAETYYDGFTEGLQRVYRIIDREES
jgi:hypothetical protein